MNGTQLKNSILQWAIQGKLVPQNPKDEPAQKLLERIALARHSEQNDGGPCHPERSAKGTKSKDPGRKKMFSPPVSTVKTACGTNNLRIPKACPPAGGTSPTKSPSKSPKHGRGVEYKIFLSLILG